jgi:predicted nucleic acid-binding protein
MRAVIVDTSALVRLYIPDGPVPDGLEGAVESAWRGDVVLLAPELLLAEVGQVLRKKERAGFMSREECDVVLDAILALPLETVPHRPLMADAMAVARETGLTVYDALFLALADGWGAKLISADERLAQAFGDK